MCGRAMRIPVWLCMAIAAVVLCATSAAVWSAEYVVNESHPRASDDNPGTAEAPLKTISKGVSMAKAGDTVTVKGGTYPEAVKIAVAGEPGRPITLRAAPGERVLITREDRRCGIAWTGSAAHLVIDGFEVRDAAISGNEGGIASDGEGGHHVTVQNCVLVGCGLYLTKQSDCTVRRTVQTGCKRNGINLNGCKNCTIEECEVFGNGADGVIAAWNSDGCTLRRNYIHNQWYDSHPDAIQVYRTVTNMTVEGNLFFDCGQGFMLEETDGGVFRNNMLVGTRHSGLVLGHSNTHNWTVEQNTIAFTGFKAIIFSGRNTVIRNNVILTGGDNKAVQCGTREPWTSDYNLVWKPDGAVYHQPKEGDTHTKFADPKFRHAPPLAGQAVYYVDKWSDEKAIEKCTPDTLCLGRKGMPGHFAVGDHVEVNFDGVVRKVTKVTDDSVSFAPPLAKVHQHGWDVIVNWKGEANFAWDLRLAEGSPGKGMGDKGQDVGSTVDMQAYMKGDFNADGKRDLPPVPKDPTP